MSRYAGTRLGVSELKGTPRSGAPELSVEQAQLARVRAAVFADTLDPAKAESNVRAHVHTHR